MAPVKQDNSITMTGRAQNESKSWVTRLLTTSQSEDQGNRGVSFVLNYAMSLMILTLLISVLLITTNGFIQDQKEQVIRAEFRVIGNHLAADISSVDQFGITMTDTDVVRLSTTVPTHVAEQPYSIAFNQSGSDRSQIILETESPSVTVTVIVNTRAPISETTVHGGDLIISHNGTTVGVSHA